jgi:hypothetical protein
MDATTRVAQERMAALKADLAALLQAQGAEQAPAPVPQSKPAAFCRGKRTEQQQAPQGFIFEE